MATKSNVVSGMGVAMSLIQTLVASVKKHGGTDEDIHRLTTPDANGVWDDIAQLVIKTRKKFGEIFTIVVNYGRSVKDGITAGHYGWVNEDITEKNFPPSNEEQGEKEQSFTLYYFGKETESDWVAQQMEQDGKRPATLRELLAFGEKNPELQREFPIIALGSVWVDRRGDRCVPFLDRGSGERGLVLGWYDGGWRAYCRVLAVGK